MTRKRISYLAGSFILLLMLGSGVFAANNIVLNSGDATNLGAGAQRVNPCDNDVNISAITYNDGNDVYLQGFQYDNADKPACVGYDFETRFVSNSGDPVNLFATSSIASEPNLVRIFAPSSSASWQLGLGAVPSVEATVSQISSSSFKIIFTNPISLASNIGRIVMAEINHLPVGSFTNGYTQVGTTTGSWYGSCFVANSSRFYALEAGTGLFKSSIIPDFPGSVSGVTSSLVTASAIPTSGVSWYGLGCSSDGKYLAIGGTNNTLAFSKDFGVTWESKTVTSVNQSSSTLITTISVSNDGQVVALTTGNTPGTFNFWVNGNFWTSTSVHPDAYYQETYGMSTVTVSGDGSTIYGGGKASSSAGLFRWQTSSITSGGGQTSLLPTYTSSSFGTYIRAIACSTNGQTVAIASPSNYQVYLTRNRFSTWYTPTTLSGSNQGATTKPYAVAMSADGRFIAVGTGDQLGSDKGTAQYSTDFGTNFSDTSFVNHYMQTVSLNGAGSRMLVGGALGTTKIVILGSN